jgi:hypothetical protein
MLALVCLSSPAFVYELMSQLIQTAIIKYHKPSDLRTTEIHFSQFWKLGSSRSMCPPPMGLVGGHWCALCVHGKKYRASALTPFLVMTIILRYWAPPYDFI